MSLFARVNTLSTEDKVRNFLTEDFPHLVVKAGYSKLDVKSPSMSGGPRASMVGNGIENGMIDHFEARRLVPQVEDAMSRCPDPYDRILEMFYVDELSEDDVLNQLHMSRSKLYRLKHQALIWFADSFEYVMDLHVYVEDDAF